MLRKLSIGFGLLLLLLATLFYFTLYPKLPFLTGYAAKKACSCHFIDKRNLKSITQFDLAKSPLNLADVSIEHEKKIATASVFGLAKSQAFYSEGTGCKLIHNQYKSSKKLIKPSIKNTEIAIKKNGYNLDKINAAVKLAFDHKDEWLKQTRALVILQNDSLIAEHYAPGFDKNSKILGWSMTKSICNALVGILVKDGQLDTKQTSLFEEWKNDKRQYISLNNLLRMTPGLEWEEKYDEISPATQMLFTESDMGDFASGFNSEFTAGLHWEYSSGTTNIINKLIRQTFKSQEEYLQFPYKRLFSKLGISSFELETDASGNYVLSSYCYGTARDWGKFGQLYLNNGIVNQDTILSKDWIDYSTTPTKASPNGEYGAQIWLNTNKHFFKGLPENVYSFNGFEGQYVIIIPDKNAVVVRMGLSKGPPFNLDELMTLIYNGLE